MNIELKQAAQDALEAIDWLLKTIRRDAPQLSGKAMGNAEKCACALRIAIQQPAQTTQTEVTDEQIATCVKRASTYGLPFVGLLNPGGTPSDFSKRLTAEILALRPVQVPMTDEQLRDCLRSCQHDTVENLRVRWLYAKEFARAVEAHHGIKPKEQA